VIPVPIQQSRLFVELDVPIIGSHILNLEDNDMHMLQPFLFPISVNQRGVRAAPVINVKRSQIISFQSIAHPTHIVHICYKSSLATD
jgi:hypothetical protein